MKKKERPARFTAAAGRLQLCIASPTMMKKVGIIVMTRISIQAVIVVITATSSQPAQGLVVRYAEHLMIDKLR